MNWKEYKTQGVQAVDMCAACIFAHRLKSQPIKAIHLLPRMYDQFKQWTERKLGRELEDGELLEFDSVKIEKGYKGQSTPLVIEMWENDFNIHAVMKQNIGIA